MAMYFLKRVHEPPSRHGLSDSFAHGPNVFGTTGCGRTWAAGEVTLWLLPVTFGRPEGGGMPPGRKDAKRRHGATFVGRSRGGRMGL